MGSFSPPSSEYFSENVMWIPTISQKDKQKVENCQESSKEYNRKHFYATIWIYGVLIDWVVNMLLIILTHKYYSGEQ